jgi:hypothetical protein
VPDLLGATVTSQLLVADASSSDLPLLCLAFLAIFLFFSDTPHRTSPSLFPLCISLPFLFSSRNLHFSFLYFSCTLGVLMGDQSLYISGSGRAKDMWKRGGIDLGFSLNVYIVSFLHLACHMSVLPCFLVDLVHIHEWIAYSFLVGIFVLDLMSNRCSRLQTQVDMITMSWRNTRWFHTKRRSV